MTLDTEPIKSTATLAWLRLDMDDAAQATRQQCRCTASGYVCCGRARGGSGGGTARAQSTGFVPSGVSVNGHPAECLPSSRLLDQCSGPICSILSGTLESIAAGITRIELHSRD